MNFPAWHGVRDYGLGLLFFFILVHRSKQKGAVGRHGPVVENLEGYLADDRGPHDICSVKRVLTHQKNKPSKLP